MAADVVDVRLNTRADQSSVCIVHPEGKGKGKGKVTLAAAAATDTIISQARRAMPVALLTHLPTCLFIMMAVIRQHVTPLLIHIPQFK